MQSNGKNDWLTNFGLTGHISLKDKSLESNQFDIKDYIFQ